MIYLLLLLVFFDIFLIIDTKRNEKKRTEHDEIYEKWIFDSLYTINPNVLLPESHEKVEKIKPATVYCPSKDGMSELNGNDEGWFND